MLELGEVVLAQIGGIAEREREKREVLTPFLPGWAGAFLPVGGAAFSFFAAKPLVS